MYSAAVSSLNLMKQAGVTTANICSGSSGTRLACQYRPWQHHQALSMCSLACSQQVGIAVEQDFGDCIKFAMSNRNIIPDHASSLLVLLSYTGDATVMTSSSVVASM